MNTHQYGITACALVSALLLFACPPTPNPTVDCDTVGNICTLVGNGQSGFNGNGKAPLDTALYYPQDVYIVPNTDTIYLIDWNNNVIRKMEYPNGNVSPFAGTGVTGDYPLLSTDPLKPATQSQLNHPMNMGIHPDGRLLIAAWHNRKIKYVDSQGMMGVYAGGLEGFSGDGGPAVDAQFALPTSIVFDADGNLYTPDQTNQRIRKIDTAGIVTTIGGTGTSGFSGDGGPAEFAEFNFPPGQDAHPSSKMVISPDQTVLYIADTNNNRIRTIDITTGTINTVVGTGVAGFDGDGGPPTNAQLNYPTDLAFDEDGFLYISDKFNHVIRRVDFTTDKIETIAGTPEFEGFDGDGHAATSAFLREPSGVFVDHRNILYIADAGNHRIRMIHLD